MRSTETKHRSDIVELTKTAVDAARLGRWDLVIQCYQDRGTMLETAKGLVAHGEELLKLDRQVRDQVQIAQALLTSLLGDAALAKHRLQGLRQRLGVPTMTPEAMSVEA